MVLFGAQDSRARERADAETSGQTLKTTAHTIERLCGLGRFLGIIRGPCRIPFLLLELLNYLRCGGVDRGAGKPFLISELSRTARS